MKFDLHIHSIASKYKESSGIVDKSTVENIGTLFKKLEENEVGLFSITDHNRFNVDLYKKIDEIIKKGDYPKVKGVLAGVEFDVKLDDEMNKCHIITIFDAMNQEENYKKIGKVITKYELKKPEGFYTKGKFELILKEIGLDVILIACQRNDLNKSDGKHNSLSESTRKPEELIKAGYIDALEFQKPNVEGILKNNLKTVPAKVGLVTGSDCHEWEAYPKHDKTNNVIKFKHSRAKILPTFKGLLLALTSPETRINQPKNKNIEWIEKFILGEKEIELVNGINAIVGENGAGKSTVLEFLYDQKRSKQKYKKEFISENELKCDYKFDESKKIFIGQGEIVDKFKSNKLFPVDNFEKISHDEFKKEYTKYSEDIIEYIRTNISKEDKKNKLKNMNLEYNERNNETTYYIVVDYDNNFEIKTNLYKKSRENMSKLIEQLKAIGNDENFIKQSKEIEKIINFFKELYLNIDNKYKETENEMKLKNYIISKINDYNMKIRDESTYEDKEILEFKENRQNFINEIIELIAIENKTLEFPGNPQILKGSSKKLRNGFSFNSESSYNEVDVHEEFLTKVFNKEYNSIEKLKEIHMDEDLTRAVSGCTSLETRDSIYEKNLNDFLQDKYKCNNYILDLSNGNKSLGSTLGEQSLAYFKYMTFNNDENLSNKSIIFIDQPEDHISNNNISKNLINYLNSMRNKKQIIIVTHNPLLVVNQDVDNVIFIEKDGNKIDIKSGCLEYENDDINMLEFIADNMDGGREAIEKRLKVYGKNN